VENWTPVSTLYHPRIVWSIWSSDCDYSFHQNTWNCNCPFDAYKYDFDNWRHISCDDTWDAHVCFWVTPRSWQLSECGDCAILSLKGPTVELTSSLSVVGAKRGILCVPGFPGVANPNNSTRKICFKETISHDSTWNTHDWNFDLDISLAWSVRGCLYNVLLWHMFSGSLSHATAWIALNNVFLYMTWACTECAPDPTHSSVCHTPWFLLSIVVELIDCLAHVWLGFWCPWSSGLPRTTGCTHEFRVVTNPNNSMKNEKTFYFTKTTLHDSFWKAPVCNCGLSAHFEAFVHKSPDNVLLWHECLDSFSLVHAMDDALSNNICHRARTYIRCGPSPTQLLLCHSLLFPHAIVVWLNVSLSPFWLCFLGPWSFVRRQMTKYIHVFRAAANPNNSMKKRKKLFYKDDFTWFILAKAVE